MEMVEKKAVPFSEMLKMLQVMRETDIMPDENGDIHFNRKDLQPVKMKLKTLQADAKDLFLCKNGEILFRMEE